MIRDIKWLAPSFLVTFTAQIIPTINPANAIKTAKTKRVVEGSEKYTTIPINAPINNGDSTICNEQKISMIW